ncbi:uncharacterized protein SPSK_04883 [Sporothrix schenckii 1099-18]|uniref:Spray n=1 Tax=Sporothrix schenckii 1099-18 TaxID=1397361 RepID=A0A0F2LXB2_SPOSC|nr:uncharacterized protein SPSK_04883 [Sporothrix schenckii 1099-18]KJR80531.1 hypothetical protein SPSK_04883 [Sporothrix schenckii 1099-18]
MDPYGSTWAPGHGPPAPSSASVSVPSSGSATPSNAPPLNRSQGSQDTVGHRISSFSDITDYDNYGAQQAAAPSPYDPQPTLRGRASLVSLDSLVYDESLNAYTRVPIPAAPPTTLPPTTLPAVAPLTPVPSAPISTVPPVLQYTDSPPTTLPAVAPSTSVPMAPTSTVPPVLQYRHLPPTTQGGGGGAWTVSTAASEPAPYSTYNSGYGASSAPTVAGATITRRLSNMLSGRQRSMRRANSSHSTIMEEGPYGGTRESIDMTSLVQNAAPMSMSPTSSKPYSRLAEHDMENGDDSMPPQRSAGGMASSSVPVDLSSFFGPTTGQDEAFIKRLHEQEARGTLTMGLGAGFEPGAKLKESELLANASHSDHHTTSAKSPTSIFGSGRGTSLGRTLSRRWASSSTASASASTPLTPTAGSPTSTSQLSRQGTVRALAQSEANRRGEIVEIIMEEEEEDDTTTNNQDNGHSRNLSDDTANDDSDIANVGSKVDLSVMSGPEGPDPLAGGGMSSANRRQSSIPLRMGTTDGTQRTQVFYPQPNWRPFSMRWPYLMTLILLSIVLGVAQELIYRMSLTRPLVKFHSPEEIPGGLYFTVKFAPTIVAVTFGVLWQITDFEVKRLEAFYQMSKGDGAVADESINVDYVTYFTFFRPFRALYCKHYAVAVSSIASLLAVSLVPTLSAATIVLTPNRDARLANPQGEKQVVIGAVWSRFLTVVLFVIAALGCVLFFLLQRRRSGLLSDVKGIAGLASMAVVSHIMTDFKGMDLVTHKEIHNKLKDHRYVLRNSSLAPDDENPVSLAERERYKEFDSHMSENPHPLMLRARGCIPYIAGILLFAALIPIVLFTPANVLTDKAAWLLTALAVAIKLGWGGLETSVRMMEPYYILWRRHAPAKTLTLDYTAMPFLWVALQALKNGHYLVFFVGFGTVMTEVLTVLVTSLATVEGHDFIGTGASSPTADTDADSGEETALSFWLTLGLVTFILSYMSIVATVVFIRRRRPFLPRQPNTIASVLAYIHQSKMLWSFVGTSKSSNAEMLVKLEAMGHKYGLGWFEGRDGKTHCGVDQEELMSSYKLGYDYSRSNKPWNDQPEEWL